MNQAVASTPIGTCLQERYVLQQVLGRGGMGAVYLARDQRLNKRVAVKELTAQTSDAESRRKIEDQFHHEAHLLASLQHPGLVSISDYFSQDGSQYLVMEYVSGVTLDNMLGHSRSYPEVIHVLDWAEQLCSVLGYLHQQSPPIIFRDMKPSNVILDGDSRIKLIDFGIARIFDPNHRTTTIIRGTGTPGFAPLEQYGDGTDTRSDIYALGATLYSLLTRTLPPTAIRLVSGEESLVLPSQINSAVSSPFEDVLLLMMSLRREDRYQTMAEVQEALRAVRALYLEAQTRPVSGEKRCNTCGATLAAADRDCPFCAQTGPQLPGGSVRLSSQDGSPARPTLLRFDTPRPRPKESGPRTEDKLDVHIFVHCEPKTEAAALPQGPLHSEDTAPAAIDTNQVTQRLPWRRAAAFDVAAGVLLGVLLAAVIALWSTRPGATSAEPTPAAAAAMPSASTALAAALEAPTLAPGAETDDTVAQPFAEGLHRVTHLQVLSARLMGESGILYTLRDERGQPFHIVSSKRLQLSVGQHVDTLWAHVSHEGADVYLSDVQFP
jgi:serine/threonine-protein kinase